MTLVFQEPETFTTPDGGEYVVLPVQVDDMPIMFRIITARTKLKDKAIKEFKKKNKTKKIGESDITIDGEEFVKECGSDLQDLITKTVIHIKTGESLPLKYRTPGNVIELMGRVMRATMPDKDRKEGDGTPLEQSVSSSGKSSQPKPT